MGRLGFGHYAGRHSSQFLAGNGKLLPDDTWDGTAGSGFATAPTDPDRLTAKPALRLLTPANQHFTDTLPVGVAAFANDGGTLVGGIDRVRFHFEGRTTDVLAPTYRAIRTASGAMREYLGYWIDLGRPADTTGEALLYVEAIPSDATMQRRIIGPFSYSPTDVLHDIELIVAPSHPESDGSSYRTLSDAIQFCKLAEAQNPRITIVEAGRYEMPARAPVYSGGTGRLLVEATTPVTIGYAGYTDDVAALMRPRYDGIHFRGSNITFDMRYVSKIAHEGVGAPYWFDGINVIVSGGADGLQWRKGPRPAGIVAEGAPCWTECDLRHANDILNDATLGRGNVLAGGYRDVASRALCLVDNVVADWDSSIVWARDVPAMTIQGPDGASLSISGGSDANSRTITARSSQTIASSFVVGKTELHFLGQKGDGYTVQDVADWINSLAGWSATVLDNSRRASALTVANQKGAGFTDLDVSSGLTLQTYFDQHGDFYQHPSGGPGENVIVTGTRLWNSFLQNIFITRDDPKDFVFLDNGFANVESANKSQLASAHSHVVIAHNTLANQDFLLAPDYVADPYCLIANNAARSLVDASNSAPLITNNVVDEGQQVPDGGPGNIAVGTLASKFVDALAGNFGPAGELLTHPKPPCAMLIPNAFAAAEQSPAGIIP